MTKSNNHKIMSTANDAILSKISTSQLGYYYDPFIPYFTSNTLNRSPYFPQPNDPAPVTKRKSTLQEVTQSESVGNQYRRKTHGDSTMIKSNWSYPTKSDSWKLPRTSPPPFISTVRQNYSPLIRRGTYARVCLVDYAISSFLSLSHNLEEVQVVILGSGRDTTYLREQSKLLHTKNVEKRIRRGNVSWYEVDFPSVIRMKYKLMQKCDLIEFDHTKDQQDENSITNFISYVINPICIHTEPNDTSDSQCKDDGETPEPYHLIGYDLCHPFDELLEILSSRHNFKRHLPTLFVMECVQMYIPENDSRILLTSITNTCQAPIIAIFDPIIQEDPFGKVMAQNLTKACVANQSMSLLNTKTLQSQVKKLYDSGFQTVKGCDFLTAYDHILTKVDRRRANSIEMLDEIEEWMLIMKHYCFVVAGGGVKNMLESSKRNNYDLFSELFTRYCSSMIGIEDSFGLP